MIVALSSAFLIACKGTIIDSKLFMGQMKQVSQKVMTVKKLRQKLVPKI
jgi:hypothetical protein